MLLRRIFSKIPKIGAHHCPTTFRATGSLAARVKMVQPNAVNPLFVLPNDTPIVKLDAHQAFKGLTPKEQLYAHYIAKASFHGSLAVFSQVSPESPAIFVVLYHLFAGESFEDLKKRALETCEISEEEFLAFLTYVVGFMANSGNYKGFGDTKFVPNVAPEKLANLIEGSKSPKQPDMMKMWKSIQNAVHDVSSGVITLGFNDEGALNTYHGWNVTRADCELVDRFLKSEGMEAYNTRLLKKADGSDTLVVYLASAHDEPKEIRKQVFEGRTVVVRTGDHAPFMKRAAKWLAEAATVAASPDQESMLKLYQESFTSGDLLQHREGSRYWIKDKGPSVESYIGFIENYRDPAGVRGEFEGFAAAVNKETSKMFQQLVDQAEVLLKLLPWGSDYEKDTFLRPDYTALDVIAFGGSGIPAGINIPNYDDIRQNDGFKNVSLCNVISAIPKQRITFLSLEDEALYQKYFQESFTVQVGLHELLGHGSGKLFFNEDGKFNFDKESVKDLLSGGQIECWYEKGDSWSSKFGEHSNAYEECRAEAVGYYLSCFEEVLKIFGHEGQEAQDIKYTNWMNEVRAGLVGMEFYNPEKDTWGQAHSRARYVLMKVCMAAGQDFVTIKECTGEDGKPDLLFTLDRSKIDSVGKPAMADFLKKLQYYKSTGDAKRGIAFFKQWDRVNELESRWRQVVMDRRTPRRLYLQDNTSSDGNGVKLSDYPTNHSGFIQSILDRYDVEDVDAVEKQWMGDVGEFHLRSL